MEKKNRPVQQELKVSAGCELEIFSFGCQDQIGNFRALEQGVWGPALKAPNGKFWLFGTYMALESI